MQRNKVSNQVRNFYIWGYAILVKCYKMSVAVFFFNRAKVSGNGAKIWCVVVDSTKNNSTHYVGRMSRDRILRDLGLSWDCKIKERSVVFDLENKLS